MLSWLSNPPLRRDASTPCPLHRREARSPRRKQVANGGRTGWERTQSAVALEVPRSGCETRNRPAMDDVVGMLSATSLEQSERCHDEKQRVLRAIQLSLGVRQPSPCHQAATRVLGFHLSTLQQSFVKTSYIIQKHIKKNVIVLYNCASSLATPQTTPSRDLRHHNGQQIAIIAL